MSKQLKKFLKKHCDDKLAVVDAKLGKVIAEKLDLKVVSGTEVLELTRGIRSQLEGLIVGLERQNMTQMSLGLSHSLSRYKLKFSPDKVDTMVVQAIGLLDDLDKELNTYAMRVREWCAPRAIAVAGSAKLGRAEVCACTRQRLGAAQFAASVAAPMTVPGDVK